MSKETIKRALNRAGLAMLLGAAGAFVSVPVNLEEPKKYLTILLFAVITGALMGLQKLVSGYVKYDIKK